MPVQYAAHSIGDRLVMVVALHQHGKEAGDGTGAALGVRAGTLQQARQFGEDARRETARGWRLPGGQADLAQGHGEARDTVHHQQHAPALVPEVLGHRHGGKCGVAPHQRCRVGSGADHDAAREASRPEIILDKLAQLAPAFPDQADHRDIAIRVACQHGHEAGLADAGGGEKAESLTAPAGGKGIQRPDAKIESRPQPGASSGLRRSGA